MNKINQYFSTLEITRGFFIALLGSAFIYLTHWGISIPLINTIFALLSLYLLLASNTKVWFWTGIFIGIFWFYWIPFSLEHYGYAWGIPVGVVLLSFVYGIIFISIALISTKTVSLVKSTSHTLTDLGIKALGLLTLSYLHPFSFDWFKPELVFVESYIGIHKWQFTLVLFAIVLAQYKKNLLYLFIVLLAYQPSPYSTSKLDQSISLVSTYTSVQDKWNTQLHQQQFTILFKHIDDAIAAHKSLVILPESVFPIFLNRSQVLIDTLQEKAKHISIVTGGLYWDGHTPRNSTYIFTNGAITIVNKVVLVPFGESNPLPDFLSDWVNKVFYDGAVDYTASSDIIDYSIDGKVYRNAICFEATSEQLYVKNKKGEYPKSMIVLSNNGWFHPSIEPTLQKLLLTYYSKKYGTTIYHAVNMSNSYVIKP